jgi:hypothetical protein
MTSRPIILFALNNKAMRFLWPLISPPKFLFFILAGITGPPPGTEFKMLLFEWRHLLPNNPIVFGGSGGIRCGGAISQNKVVHPISIPCWRAGAGKECPTTSQA